MFKKYYQDFLSANPELIHMAGHSHHYWPDVAKEGILAAYEDTKNLSDLKWDKILGEVVPKSQKIIADILSLKHPEQICFASNTHELLVRLLSCFDPSKPIRILTTDSEFHSANRQFRRMEELPNVEIKRVEVGAADFRENFLDEIKKGGWNLIFISQVFFNSGISLPISLIEEFVNAKEDNTLFCLDGYHGFCAVPTNLSSIEDNIFYLAGGYKYAQAGEGMCFMTIPKGCELRPINTGWFGNFAGLDKAQLSVSYANDGWRFAGSTRDFTAHYRFNFVWENFLNENLDVPKMHDYVQSLQAAFLDDNPHTAKFHNTELSRQGHFLSLKTGSSTLSESIWAKLKKNSILTDYRGEDLRFGFGLYLSSEDVIKVRDFLKEIEL